MIFVTLGTTDMKFDRILKSLDIAIENGLIEEKVVAQIGCAGYEPKNMEFERMMDKTRFDDIFSSSSLIIGHAGMGTIKMALDKNKPLLIVPRLSKFGEHVNDHQLHTARKFEALGHIVCLYDPTNEYDLIDKLKEAKSFIPNPRVVNADEIANDILVYIHG